MADATKTRGTQLIRADRTVSGVVTFYDSREKDAAKAKIGEVKFPADVVAPAHVIKAAIHGWTQNILDSSNKLEGDARVKFVKEACTLIAGGGWASAPVDEEAAKTAARTAIDKMVSQGVIKAEMAAKMKKDAGL